MTILKHEIPFDVKIEISSPQLLIIIKNFAKAKPLILFYHNVKHISVKNRDYHSQKCNSQEIEHVFRVI